MPTSNHANLLVRRNGQLHTDLWHKTTLDVFQDVEVLESGCGDGSHPVIEAIQKQGSSLDHAGEYGMVAIDFDSRWIGGINAYTLLGFISPVLMTPHETELARQFNLPHAYREHPHLWSQISCLDMARNHRFIRAFDAGAIGALHYGGEMFDLEQHGLSTAEEALAFHAHKRQADVSQGCFVRDNWFEFSPSNWRIEDFDPDQNSRGWKAFFQRLVDKGMLPSNHTAASLEAMER